MRAHRLLAVVGLATYHLVTALGVFVLLMLVLPSRAVAWLAQHFTLVVMAYAALGLLLGCGLWLILSGRL